MASYSAAQNEWSNVTSKLEPWHFPGATGTMLRCCDQAVGMNMVSSSCRSVMHLLGQVGNASSMTYQCCQTLKQFAGEHWMRAALRAGTEAAGNRYQTCNKTFGIYHA